MDARGSLLDKPSPPVAKPKKLVSFKFNPPPEGARKTSRRMVSIIIPAHNEEAYLERTLEAVQHQNYDRFELIVVANGCTDRTAEVARGRCQRLIVLSQKSLGVARNLGARMARGDLLLFLDADTLLEPMALRRIVEEFGDRDAAGTIAGQPDSQRLSYRAFYWVKNFVHHWLQQTGSSGVIICWRRQFIEIGGFDEALEVRENSELIKRLRHYGKYRYIGDVTATTSMRRYEQRGFARMTWLWLKLWLLSVFGDLHQRRYEPVR